MKKRAIFFSAALLLFTETVLAQTTSTDGVLDIVRQAMSNSAASIIAPKVMGWLGALLTLQFVLSNTRSLLTADLQEGMVKVFGAFISAGMCILLMNYGPELIDSAGNSLMGEFLASVPSASSILASTLGIAGALLGAAGIASALNDALASVLVTCFWIVCAGGAYLACKVFMFYLELGMIVLISPVSFALFGMSTFKEQGLAPIKGVISLLYRALLFGCIFGAYKYVNDSLADVINNTTWIDVTSLASNITKLIGCLLAYPVLLFLAFKSDSIASSLASGSSSMGTGDVAQAAAAGAAAGSAAAAAGSATTGAAGAAPQSMANFMSGLNGGGSIKNAGGTGGGGSPAPFVPPTPSMSRGGGASGGGGAGGGASTGGANKGASAMSGSGKPSGGSSGSVASGRYGGGSSGGSTSNASNTAQPGSDQHAAATQAQEGVDSSAQVETAPSNQIPDTANNDSMSIHPTGGPEQSAPNSAAVSASSGNTGKQAANAGSAAAAANGSMTAAAGAAKGTGASQPANASAPGSPTANGSQAATPGAGQGSGASQPGNSPAMASSSGDGGGGGSSVTSPTYGQASAQGPSGAGSAPQANSASANSAGSGSTAAIGPGSSNQDQMQQTLNQIAQQLASQAPRKPTFSEKMGEANRQVAQEQTATHIAMNAHQQD